MKSYFSVLVLIFLFFSACNPKSIMVVTEEGKIADYTYAIPFEISPDNKKDTLVKQGIIYAGMPEEDLKDYGFTKNNQINHFKREDKEFLVFRQNADLGVDKIVTFVVKDGKIIDWLVKERLNSGEE